MAWFREVPPPDFFQNLASGSYINPFRHKKDKSLPRGGLILAGVDPRIASGVGLEQVRRLGAEAVER